MIRHFFASIFCIVFFLPNSHGQDYNIKLKIEGIKNDTAIIAFVSVENSDDEMEDLAIISNGELKYKFDKSGFYYGAIVPSKLVHKFENGRKFGLPSSKILFFINNGDILNIKAVVTDKIVAYQTSGNNLSTQLAEARTYFNQSELSKDRMELEYKFHKKEMAYWTKDDEAQYWKRRTLNDSIYAKRIEEFVLRHPDYDYSPRLILDIRDDLQAKTLYNRLTPEAKSSYFGQILTSQINSLVNIISGAEFPSFRAETLSGKDFNLSDYKGKYVLLDFWGSWCQPCIKEIPDLERLQSDFQDKLVIVGLVCDDSREKVNKIIEKYNVSWTQLYDDENKFPKTYGLKTFPTKVLIDDKGLVVKKIEGASEQVIAELRELLE